jgi:hypothetical protein
MTSIMKILLLSMMFVAPFASAARPAATKWVSGSASSYCANPKKLPSPPCFRPNACGVYNLPKGYEQYFAALPEKVLGGNCGKCVQVIGQHGSVIAKVVDSFVDSRNIVINLSNEALMKATGFSVDVKPVKYQIVKCP